MRAAALASLFAPAAALVLACSGASNHSGFDTAGDGGSSGGSSGGLGSSGSGGSSGGLGSSGGSGSSSGANGCSGQAADFVYVLSAENDLYRFAPAAKQFTKIGPLGCQTGGMQPNSMAVDRNAVAYVNYVQSDPLGGQDTAGAIYQVSTSNAGCMGKVLDLPGGWYRVGMGYSSNGTGSTAETLYVAATGNGMGGQSQGLGLVDFGKKTVGPIGPFTGSLSGQNAELTGTGDGRLYGFFTTNPVEVAQITKTSGATQTPVPMTGVQTPNDWAFSFWGGHFYLYTSQGQGVGNGSDVTDYDPSTGNVDTTYMTGIGFDIVGAGVSTCAPVMPPQ